MTATELSRRKWRDAKKNGIAEEADYRWPALPVQSKGVRHRSTSFLPAVHKTSMTLRSHVLDMIL